MNCKDCTYFTGSGDHVINKTTGWCPSWCLCSYWQKTGTVENDWREICSNFKRKQVPETCKDCEHYLYESSRHFSNEFSCLMHRMIYTTAIKKCNCFERKIMSDRIEIDVKVNGEPAKLSDISDETLANIKKSEQVKPIVHGDYGYIIDNKSPINHRLFIGEGERVAAYCDDGEKICDNVNSPNCTYDYTITGNIFKDMKNAQ